MNKLINQIERLSGMIFDFQKRNSFVFYSGILALVYCIVCIVFKTSSCLNVSTKLQLFGDLFYNISISVIAAVIFYIVQVYLPNQKRNKDIQSLIKRYCIDVLLKECNVLKVRIDAVRDGKNRENEIINAIESSCLKVNSALNNVLENYLSVLPTELISVISNFRSDNMLYEITERATGRLRNRSLEEIVTNDSLYHPFWTLIEEIKKQTAKM